MKSALVLAGHGSHISPLTAGIVWQQVDALRMLGVADEITATFWKETPSFANVLNTLIADDITIVPLFTAQGYFTRSVIPAEMGLEGDITATTGRTIRYARTLGEHSFINRVVRKRVVDTLQLIGKPPHNVGVALIGHGTKRNPHSRAATEALVDRLRAENMVSGVAAVYLDDTPGIPEVYKMLNTPVIIAVPNFLALGSHTTIDVPEALGLKAGNTHSTVEGREVYYTDPVGVDASLNDVILELARDAGAALNRPMSGTGWDCFPSAGRDELIEVVHQQGELQFGQLVLTPTKVQVVGDGATQFDDVGALRHHIRTMATFRPLATSTDLPGGWCVPIHEPHHIHAVVETVYPGAVADWAAQRRGTLTINPLPTVAERQQGMFRALADFTRVEALVLEVCGGCVRHPTWYDWTNKTKAIPCTEACNAWLSEALENDK